MNILFTSVPDRVRTKDTSPSQRIYKVRQQSNRPPKDYGTSAQF